MMVYYTVIYDEMVTCNFGFVHLESCVATYETLKEAKAFAKKVNGEIEEITDELEIYEFHIPVA